jgi:hypothetical protein
VESVSFVSTPHKLGAKSLIKIVIAQPDGLNAEWGFGNLKLKIMVDHN